jgi:hypothetical protein
VLFVRERVGERVKLNLGPLPSPPAVLNLQYINQTTFKNDFKLTS